MYYINSMLRKKTIIYFCLLSLIINNFNYLKACNFPKDIKKYDNDTYLYHKNCHLLFGKMLYAKEQLDQLIKNLQDQINIKDEKIKILSQQNEEYYKLSKDLEIKLTKEQIQNTNAIFTVGVLGFALGLLTAFLIKK